MSRNLRDDLEGVVYFQGVAYGAGDAEPEGATFDDRLFDQPKEKPATKADLQAEIDRRNEGRSDDQKITPAGSNKADLEAALEADDQAQSDN